MFGWQSTQCAKNASFKPVPSQLPFIQIVHVAGCHWVVVSNVDHTGGRCTTASIGYYDSGQPITVSVKVKGTICSFFEREAAIMHFDIINVIKQPK